jgi:hypothetical protein
MDDMSTHIKSMCVEFLFFLRIRFSIYHKNNNNNNNKISTNLINFSFDVIFFEKMQMEFSIYNFKGMLKW